MSPRGIDEAVRLRDKARKGPPSEYDRPPNSVLPGKKHKPLRGQLDFFGGEHGRPPEPQPEERE